MSQVDSWVVIGRIGRPQGIRGQVTVEVRTDDPDGRFADGARLLREAGDPLEVLASQWHGGRLLLTLDGVLDRTGAEALRDTLVYADPAADPPLDDPDEFYDSQLVGLVARQPDGTLLGMVTGVLHPPGGDLLAIARADEGGELLIPFVRAFVPEIDIQGGTLLVVPPDGLLDL